MPAAAATSILVAACISVIANALTSLPFVAPGWQLVHAVVGSDTVRRSICPGGAYGIRLDGLLDEIYHRPQKPL